ncbi:MAG: UvrD-helicase domain-containing protein [Candidatus Cloacimonetes bacterium]|nr:UvrD-helicase domain-containing protein [Candidatus Cloacimonadota bacterium]
MQLNNTVIISAAGSGKTFKICKNAKNNLGQEKRVLLITYTNRGKEAIINEYKKQNLGVLDKNIIIKTWFQFLLSDWIKPYQASFFHKINLIKSFDFTKAYGFINKRPISSTSRYITRTKNILSNEASRLALLLNEKSSNAVINRLKRVYNNIYIDEVQDLSGDDINILEVLFDSDINTYCVGDPKQSTYKTYNTNKYRDKTGKNIFQYFESLNKDSIVNLEVDNKSRRCNADICKLANIVHPSEPVIESLEDNDDVHKGVFIISSLDINEYYNSFKPMILRYDKRTKCEYSEVLNYGVSKGLTFDRILIYPNQPLVQLLKSNKALKSPEKYYVAVTRAKHSVCIVLDKMEANNRFSSIKLQLNNGNMINAFKLI